MKIKKKIAVMLYRFADIIYPPPPKNAREYIRFAQLAAMPGYSRIDWDALDKNQLKIKYYATNAIWSDIDEKEFLIDLREHVRRLLITLNELSFAIGSSEIEAAAYNLKMAYSLTDVFADTDVDGASMWCGPVADYEATDAELTEKHLAAVVVFNFVWTAYERIIESVDSGSGGRGARGRDFVRERCKYFFPYLSFVLHGALELDAGGTDFKDKNMIRMLNFASIPAIAAEHLRQFRNRVVHGDLEKPPPMDWGAGSEYVVDADPHLRRFYANTRLTLMLIQLISGTHVNKAQEIDAWLDDPCDARIVLEFLHCAKTKICFSEPELDFGLVYF